MRIAIKSTAIVFSIAIATVSTLTIMNGFHKSEFIKPAQAYVPKECPCP